MKLFSIKSFSMKLVFVIPALMLTISGWSQPMYYTFEGNVTGITETGMFSPAADGGVTIDSLVSYVFKIDRLRESITVFNNGDIRIGADIIRDDITVDRFYVEYVSGSLIDGAVDGGFYTNPSSSGYSPENIANDNSGVLVIEDNTYTAKLSVGSLDDGIRISYSGIENYRVGSQWTVRESAGVLTPVARQAFLDADVVLTSISNRNPSAVPELDVSGAPITFALIAGIAGIAFERRRKQAQKG